MNKPSTERAPAGPAPSTEPGAAPHAWRAGLLPTLIWVLAALVQFVGAPVYGGAGSGAQGRTSPADIASLLSSPSAGRDMALSQQEERRSPVRPPSRAAAPGTAAIAAAEGTAFPPAAPGAPAAWPPVPAAAGFLDSRFPTGPPARA